MTTDYTAPSAETRNSGQGSLSDDEGTTTGNINGSTGHGPRSNLSWAIAANSVFMGSLLAYAHSKGAAIPPGWRRDATAFPSQFIDAVVGTSVVATGCVLAGMGALLVKELWKRDTTRCSRATAGTTAAASTFSAKIPLSTDDNDHNAANGSVGGADGG